MPIIKKNDAGEIIEIDYSDVNTPIKSKEKPVSYFLFNENNQIFGRVDACCDQGEKSVKSNNDILGLFYDPINKEAYKLDDEGKEVYRVSI